MARQDIAFKEARNMAEAEWEITQKEKSVLQRGPKEQLWAMKTAEKQTDNEATPSLSDNNQENAKLL